MNKDQIIHIRIATDKMDQIRKIATDQYRSVNNQIVLIIDNYLKQTKE